jgi:hypothetical protein
LSNYIFCIKFRLQRVKYKDDIQRSHFITDTVLLQCEWTPLHSTKELQVPNIQHITIHLIRRNILCLKNTICCKLFYCERCKKEVNWLPMLYSLAVTTMFLQKQKPGNSRTQQHFRLVCWVIRNVSTLHINNRLGGLIMIDCSVEIINRFLCLSSHLTENMVCLHYKHYLHKYM